MYSETLPTEKTFAVDPLEQQLAKKDIRKTAFKNYFPSFDVIVQAIANGNDVFFRDAISILHTANKTPFSPIMFNFFSQETKHVPFVVQSKIGDRNKRHLSAYLLYL